MNQKRNLTSINSSPTQRALLTGGLGWLGGISILSAGVGFAQTAPSIEPVDTTVPSAEDLLQSDFSSSPLQVPSDSVGVDDLQPVEAPEVELLAPEPIESSEFATPTEGTELDPGFATDSNTADSLVSPNLAEDASNAFGESISNPSGGNISGGNAASQPPNYIDSTPYNLGATQPDVVLSERSTGCQAVLKPGQTAPGSICPPAPVEDSFAQYGGEYGGSGGYAPSSDYSVFSLASDAVTSARNFYNLTVRPPARLSNGNVSLLFPLSIPAAITSAFGWRLHPVMGSMRFHSGTDIGAPEGTPVLAAFDGKVEIADVVGGYGLTVVLQHNKGTEQTLYAHMSELFVKPGEDVKQGEVIGRVGSTGMSTGPHLHFEFRKLTQEGWVVMDAGLVLEQALAQFIQSLQVAQVNKSQLPAVFQYPGKSLRVTKTNANPQANADSQKNGSQTPQSAASDAIAPEATQPN